MTLNPIDIEIRIRFFLDSIPEISCCTFSFNFNHPFITNINDSNLIISQENLRQDCSLNSYKSSLIESGLKHQLILQISSFLSELYKENFINSCHNFINTELSFIYKRNKQ